MLKEQTYYVYILASHRNGTLYTGVTNSLLRRTSSINSRRIKKVLQINMMSINWFIMNHTKTSKTSYIRNWKLKIIEEQNPQWKDLFTGME